MRTSEQECIKSLQKAADWLGKSPTKTEYEELGLRPASGTIIRVVGGYHSNPGEKTMAITGMVTHGYGRERLSNEMAKCVVLCANCHRKEHGTRQDTNESLRGWSHRYKHRHGCSRCDERNPCALVFHHTTGQKRMTVAQMISDGYPRNEIIEEIEKCELLCANCHRKEHVGGPDPNG